MPAPLSRSAQTEGHTPGPWRTTRPFGLRDTIFIQARHLGKDETVVIVSTARDECKEQKIGRETVSRTYTKKRLPCAEANAQLIAASPDMLAALREAELQIVYLHEKFGATGSGEAALAKIRAAIAQTEGR